MTDDRCPPELAEALNPIIAKYGRELVRDCAIALTRPPRGRRPEGDWRLLADDLKRDAADWLNGRTRASNSGIAKRFARKYPGHSEEATARRIQKKLGKRREEQMLLWVLVLTGTDKASRAKAGLDAANYPFAAHFRTLEKLVALDPAWEEWLKQDRLTLARYREIHGDPDPAMPWSELQENARRAFGGLLETA